MVPHNEHMDPRTQEAISEVLRDLIPALKDCLQRGWFGELTVAISVQDGIVNHIKSGRERTKKMLAPRRAV